MGSFLGWGTNIPHVLLHRQKIKKEKSKLRVSSNDFPDGSVVKNPPSSAEDTGFDIWSRKIPHAMG